DLGGEAGAVGAVADDRMADRREMDADLVGPTGLQPAFDQRGDRRLSGRAIGFGHAVMGDRLAAGTVAALHLDLLAVADRAAERQVDGRLPTVGHAPGEGEITALERSGAAMVGEL